jgi:hypothetical protein
VEGRENEIRGEGKMVGGWFFNFVDLTKKKYCRFEKVDECKKVL